jgi:long-chain acyl-CoA synthetase
MTEVRFSRFAQKNPEAIAVVEARGGRTIRRGQLFADINRLSRGLRARGIKDGDVLAIMAPNVIEYLTVYMAATQIGLHVVPINWHLSPGEITHILADSGTRVLVAHERQHVLARAVVADPTTAPELLVSMGRIPGFVDLDSLTSGLEDGPLEDPVEGRLLMYTSATTGMPKAIKLTLNDAGSALDRIIAHHLRAGVKTEGDNVHLCASMLYHSAPIEGGFISLHLGHKVVLIDRWEPELLLRQIEEHKVTTVFMVPTMFVRLLKLPYEVRQRYDVSSLRMITHAAAPCPVETKQQIIEWFGPIVCEGYGASEGCGTWVTSPEWLKYPGTVGRPIHGSKVKILNDGGDELPPNTNGLIYLTRYTGDRFEYRGAPEKTLAAYRGEFFTVGDIGYLNEDGYLFICDRKVDMIITGGMNIYSAEIERILVQHPKVVDCAVFGIPDELTGEAVNAAVQVLPGVVPDNALTADILRFLAQRLSATKIPRRVEYLEEFPRDPNGKLFKRRLREPYWQGRTRQI